MTTQESSQVWVPEACALPTAEQPLRVAEFAALFATALHSTDRTAPTTLRLVLERSIEETARELAARETACCPFFAFTFDHDPDGQLVMTVTVPAAYTQALEGLAKRATTAGGVQA
jgi:hypothetical protein